MQPTLTAAPADPQPDPFASLAAELARRLPADEVAGATDLLRRAYASTPSDELAELGVDAVVGPIVALWKLAQERRPGQVNIRVYNPQQQRDGWSSPHTAIDVVNDDMPFLLASTKTELQRQQRATHMVLHPVLGVERDADGKLRRLLPRSEGIGESWMHFEIDRETTGEEGHAALAARLFEVLGKVRVVVEDWRAMIEKAKEIEAELRREPPPTVPREEVEEAAEFLRWLTDNHFTFLGYRRYKLDRAADGSHLRLDAGPGLGIHREMAPSEERRGARLPDYLDSWLRQRELLIINKASTKSEVHRPVHIDSIGIRRYDEAGNVVGEDRFSGIFTTRAYGSSAASIPLLRRKMRRTSERANFSPGSHDAKGLVRVIEGFPRDELFQISEDDLFRIATGILQLEQRQRVALFVRRDELERFISALVFVPRDRYDAELQEKLGKILAQELGGPVVAVYTTVGDAPLARVQYILVTTPGEVPKPDLRQVEAKLATAARTWREELRDGLVAARGEEEGLRLLSAWGEAFPAAYRDRFGTGDAVADVEVAESMLRSGEEFAARLYRTADADVERLRVKLYLAGRQVALTDALPLLENLGVRVEEELPFEVNVAGGGEQHAARAVWIHDFGLAVRGEAVDFDTAKPLVEETLRRVWHHELENGVLNRLVLAAGLHWRQLAMLRAYSRYLRQVGMTFSQTYIAQTMVQHREVSQLLVQLFCTLFDPAGEADARSRAAAVLAEIREKLETVASLDEDRILRGFMTVIKETLRTNFFQRGADGHHKPYMSFKLDSKSIRQLPDPKPRFEIFVYSPRMEGIHLRGGMVARGGIRWSDRREDFRTEILGLLKAQMVKNAVIVPVGAKGGFVVKKPPASGGRDALQAEGIACYQTLVRGLLDVTDNIVDGEIVHPRDVVRHDGDDSYLVVAADKGTATFSDIANALSADYDHWLGDAFASGGSVGYDHKKMGITAKGAWVAVQRHFREMGKDIQSEPFTCVGVGDMSGDVFGNGMLLSRHTRLIAAFDHRHIFVDPDPDEAKSFEERKYLFEQPRSSWADYDRAALSPGGDVFERTAKQVTLSDEAAAALGLGGKRKLTPNELVQAILLANVDLLWLGGIGTFVKATSERHGEVGDRANDQTRIDAKELRCKVVGEGANLGFTQRARIEYALHGGRINTDAIDNSAGVDTSDHEVNIKIALNEAVRSGKLSSEGRNDLLRQMTDEVAALVLRDNYLQTQAISLTESMSVQLLDRHAQMIRAFERSGRLDRKIEFLPDEEEIRQRAASKRGLVRPELAVLLAYAKIALYDDLLASDVPDDPLLAGDLLRYFPQPMVEGYRDEIERHRLRREIIATYITNSTINRVGPSFVFRMMETTGRSAQEVARAYTITRDAFELRKVWTGIEALDNKVGAELQVRMLQEVRQLTEQATLWFLQRYDGHLDVSAVVGTYGPPLQELARELEGLLPQAAKRELKKRSRDYVKQHVPEKLAQQVTAMRGLLAGTDVVRLALAMEAPTPEVARVYFGVGERLGVEWLRAAAATIKVETPWQRAAVESVVDDFALHQVAITWQVLAQAGKKAEWREALQGWEARHPSEVARLDKLLEDLRAQEAVDLAMLAVADRQLKVLSER